MVVVPSLTGLVGSVVMVVVLSLTGLVGSVVVVPSLAGLVGSVVVVVMVVVESPLIGLVGSVVVMVVVESSLIGLEISSVGSMASVVVVPSLSGLEISSVVSSTTGSVIVSSSLVLRFDSPSVLLNEGKEDEVAIKGDAHSGMPLLHRSVLVQYLPPGHVSPHFLFSHCAAA
jgi:hypothetical protein